MIMKSKKPPSSFSFVIIAYYCFLGHFSTHMMIMAQVVNNVPISVNVGVILDMDSWLGKMTNSCVFMAINDFYSTHHNYATRLVLHTRDSKGDVLDAASAALDLLTTLQVQAIIGPDTSEQAGFIADLADKTHVPIISSSITSPLFSNRSPYFVQTMINDSFQVTPLVTIIEGFRWTEVVLVHEESDYGSGIIPYLIYNLQRSNILVSSIYSIPLKATYGMIYSKLRELLLGQTRVFIVHISPSLGSLLLTKAKEMGMMSQGFVWIITDGFASQLESMNLSVINSVHGAIGIKSYVLQTEELNDFTAKWKKYFQKENPEIERDELSIYGLRAYDTVWALAMAVESVHTLNSTTPRKQVITMFKDLGKLLIRPRGSQLLETILKMKFKGLSGEFNLMNGPLQPPTYQIVNVIEQKGEREIGFWTSACGISRQLQVKNKKNCYSTSINKLGPIIWPGEPMATPKGWMLPSMKILMVGVPTISQFNEFSWVQIDPETNNASFSGYSIDVFIAVVDSLPFDIKFEFVPIEVSPGDEDDLIDKVILKDIDVLVAATSIQLNQSFYVDFSIPYTDLGVSMIVPLPTDKRKNGWIFLKPFTTNLWLTAIASFIFTVSVVCLLEHQIDVNFWKKPKIRLSTIFWFSLPTSVHRERVESNMSKFVRNIWVIVVFVLTSSYTASLSSVLTVQQLTTITISSLKSNNDYVGYRRGSFVLELLKRWYLDESKLKPLSNSEEYHEALSKGSGNGGVAAIIDEIPYIEAFLSKYCERYTSIGPIYNSDGFGFVFQKGSHLAPEFSQAISKLKGQGEIDHIRNKWVQPVCKNMTIPIPSNSLSLDSFRVLFLFMIGASLLAALFHIILAFHENYQKRVVQSTTNNIDDVVVNIIPAGREEDDEGSSISTVQISNTPSSQEVSPNLDDEQAGM